MSALGNLVSRGLRHVMESAATAAANRPVIGNSDVLEITGRSSLEDVSRYPVYSREGCVILHGPIEVNAFSFSNKPLLYNIILHVPKSDRMFSLFRSNEQKEAEEIFVLYKETFPALVPVEPAICEKEKLDRMCIKLRENRGWTAIHVAAAFELLRYLDDRVRLNNTLNTQEGVLNRTALHVAIVHKSVASVVKLLDLGAVIDIKDIKENSILHLAAESSLQVLQVVIDRLPEDKRDLVDHLNSQGCTPLHVACKSNNPEIVKALLNMGANVNIPSPSMGYPIHTAVKARSVCSIQELIMQNPSQLSLKDLTQGGTPLHWCTGHETLVPLLELGCDPNICNNLGNTPLHDAARRGCLKSTLSLLCHSAFPEMKGEQGDTPLHVAARLCSRSVIQALIVFGAAVNVTNSLGFTPRHLVCTSQRSDKDEILFLFHAVGAKRCTESLKDHCTEGCIYSEAFGGIPPNNFPQYVNQNLLHEAMYVFGMQKDIQDRVSVETKQEPMNEQETVEADGTSAASSNSRTRKSSDRPDGYLESQIGGRLLCLDGGGIRGILITQMLLVMEQEFGVPVIDVFDWVAGTSTGGILALALACGKSVAESQAIYLRLKDKVFVGERPYKSDVMEEFLKQEFGCDKKMSSIRRPRVMVMSAVVDRRPADLHIFRNYLSPSTLLGVTEPHSQTPEDQFVWETAKVTGAAPSYFRLDNSKFIDGGLIANNPTLDALTELQQFNSTMRALGDLKERFKVPSVVVSMGTGIQPGVDANAALLDITWPSGIMDAITKVPRLVSLVNLLIDQATQSEGQVVERARSWCSSIGVPYFRFSPLMSTLVDLDEKDDDLLVNLMWETRAYMIANKASIIEMKHVLFDRGSSPPIIEEH